MKPESESHNFTLYLYSLNDANSQIRVLSIALLLGSENSVGWSLFMETVTKAVPILTKLPLVFIMYVCMLP